MIFNTAVQSVFGKPVSVILRQSNKLSCRLNICMYVVSAISSEASRLEEGYNKPTTPLQITYKTFTYNSSSVHFTTAFHRENLYGKDIL